jgi:hypothetical protein
MSNELYELNPGQVYITKIRRRQVGKALYLGRNNNRSSSIRNMIVFKNEKREIECWGFPELYIGGGGRYVQGYAIEEGKLVTKKGTEYKIPENQKRYLEERLKIVGL